MVRDAKKEERSVDEKKKKERIGKKPHKNKPASKRYLKYKIESGKLVKEKSCPRCGVGIFLMKAKNRLYCGKCHYTSFDKEEIERANK